MRQMILAIALAALLVPCAAATTIYDIQYTTDPSGDSPLVGQQVTTAGVVTAVHYNGFVMYEGTGPWQSIFVFTYTAAAELGDAVELTGTVAEYYGMTEIADLESFTVVSTGNPVTPLVLDPAVASQEMYESVLISVEDVAVTALLSYGEWTVDGTLICDDLTDYLYFPQIGDQLDTLTGTVFYSFGTYRLVPRFTADVSGDVIAHYALGGTVVTMNENRDVLADHWVEILGDRIVGITPEPPAGIATLATGGLIFPGLIDSHNHPPYNVLGPIPFEQLYEHRDEWRSDPIYDEFNAQYYAILDNPVQDAQFLNAFKLAEVRAMCAGTTTIQGRNCNGHDYDDFAHQGIGINNAERFPPRIYSRTFPLSDSQAVWQARAGDNWRRFIIHLAEGTNQTARDEFAAWQDLGMLDERTTVIHGTALQAPEWAAMAAADAHLIWSPQSNVMLYGTTTDIPGALAAGLNVALAPDWTESGSNDLLAEMKFARDWSDNEWGGLLTPQILAEMVTCNGAEALGMADNCGSIAAGLRADLMVVPGNADAPYDALLAADPVDVALTVVNGRPGYGDPALMDQFGYLDDVETITIAEQPKRLALAIDAHAIDESDVLFSVVIGALESAYDEATPQLCCFRGLEVEDCNETDVPDLGPTLATMDVHPNPFNPRTNVSFTLQGRADVILEVYEVSGKQVATLAAGRFDAGDHTLAWEGRDGSGYNLPSGVYLVRLAAGTTVLSQKVTLLR
jgi:5-methylthioadenosine/S-adenosylhomocysteine deaminase